MGKGRASKGKECLGVFGTGQKCKRARDKSGLPILLAQNCKHCKEQRCKAHCKCARTKSVHAKGRSAPRGVGVTGLVMKKVLVTKKHVLKRAPKVARPVSKVAPVPLKPVGRASAPTCQMLETEEFYKLCCSDIAGASEVELASFLYDNPRLQKVLLQRLGGRAAFSLNVFLDQREWEAADKKYQGPRVRALLAAGAKVFLCKGLKGQGRFHAKAVVIDRRRLYTGSPNLTYASECNEEFCFRITGPAVGQALEKLAAQKQRAKVLDGS